MPHSVSVDRVKIAQLHFGALATQNLVGKKIVDVGWVSRDDTGLDHYAICLMLEDDTGIMVMSDDEGNDAGALFVVPGDPKKEQFTLPRI